MIIEISLGITTHFLLLFVILQFEFWEILRSGSLTDFKSDESGRYQGAISGDLRKEINDFGTLP